MSQYSAAFLDLVAGTAHAGGLRQELRCEACGERHVVALTVGGELAFECSGKLATGRVDAYLGVPWSKLFPTDVPSRS